jgi:PqqD family protein of HPr-rel-A system
MVEKLLCWQITPGCRLLRRAWDDESIVYNTGSGDTHLLDHLSSEVLKSLEESPQNLPQLTARFSPILNVDSEQELASFLSDLLPRLQNLGLIEPAIQ